VVLECDICSKLKASWHLLYKLLKLPLTPRQAWLSITLNFIVKLPPSTEPITGFVFNSIIVVINRLTKYNHFVLYEEATNAKALIYIFLKVVIAGHGLPNEIILNRDKLFTLKF
jgi:hypothetical protein